MRSTWAHRALLAVLALGGNVSSNFAQVVPWDVFIDPLSDSVCDVVNAGNREVVVLSDTGELVVVTGNDYTLSAAAFVDVEGTFYYDGILIGHIVFADDGDGFRTVWLLDFSDYVLELDPITGEPIFTDLFPDDFVNVPCDAFELWDDDDFDDVPDVFDLCPLTPQNTAVDADGCACFEVDSDGDGLDDCDDECPFDFGNDPFGCPCEEFDDDLDGVNNCFDECTDTPLNTFVTEEGCPCVEFDEDDDGVNDCFDDCFGTPIGVAVDGNGCRLVVVAPPPVTFACGNFSALTMALTFGTLVTLRLSRRRYS